MKIGTEKEKTFTYFETASHYCTGNQGNSDNSTQPFANFV